jgi:hypothetical protein
VINLKRAGAGEGGAKGETWNLGTRIWQAHDGGMHRDLDCVGGCGPVDLLARPNQIWDRERGQAGCRRYQMIVSLGCSGCVLWLSSHLVSQPVPSRWMLHLRPCPRPVRRLVKKRPEPTISSQEHNRTLVMTGSFLRRRSHPAGSMLSPRARSGGRVLLRSPCEGGIGQDTRAPGPLQYANPMIAWKPETAGRRADYLVFAWGWWGVRKQVLASQARWQAKSRRL